MQFPSLNLIPIEDIARYLEAVGYSYPDRTGKFLTTESDVTNVTKINNISSTLYALAAIDENGELIQDNKTVMNSLKLNGLDAEMYLNKIDDSKLLSLRTDVTNILCKEIADLRDELYQLRGELAKNGFVKNYSYYAGFQDFFNKNNIKYLINSETDDINLCLLESTNGVQTEVETIVLPNDKIISIGDYFILANPDENLSYLCYAKEVNGTEVTLSCKDYSTGIPKIIDPKKFYILKVKGNYINGTFSFSFMQDKNITDKESYTMLNDDINTTSIALTKDKQGVGIGLNIPKLKVKDQIGDIKALKQFSIRAKYNGTPGALTCYLIDKNQNPNWENFDGITGYLAKSKPVLREDYEAHTLDEIIFDFYDEITQTYPDIVINSVPYLFLIVVETADEINNWQIEYSNSNLESKDVQINNIAYDYKNEIVTQNDTIGDMIFALVSLDIEEYAETPFRDGLYTSQSIKIHNNNALSHARLTLRINREGNILIDEPVDRVIKSGEPIHLKTNEVYPDLGIKVGDLLVIDNQIVKAKTDSTNNFISVDKTIVVKNNMFIYKISYDPIIKAKETYLLEDGTQEVKNEYNIKMNLTTVMKDDIYKNDSISDRLVFECDFKYTKINEETGEEEEILFNANEIQLQIAWKTDITNIKPSFIGRIYDLSLSLDDLL